MRTPSEIRRHSATPTVLGESERGLLLFHAPEAPGSTDPNTLWVKTPETFLPRHLVIDIRRDDSSPRPLHLVGDILTGCNSNFACWGEIDARVFVPWPRSFFGRLIERSDRHEIASLLCNLGRLAAVPEKTDIRLRLSGPSGVIYAKVMGDLLENATPSDLPAKWQCLFPFSGKPTAKGDYVFTAQPQIVLGCKRLVYAGAPRTFILRDITYRGKSFWKDAGKKPTPMEEFAPIPPATIDAIGRKATLAQIEATIENIHLPTIQVSDAVSLHVECIGQEQPFFAHFLADVIH